jgi:hypothetical protein
MKKNHLLFFLLMTFAFLSHQAFSQKTSTKKTKKKAVKESIGSSAAKNWAVGLRLGDPLGLTVKKYFGSKLGIEFNFGKTFFWGSGYDRYYQSQVPNPPPGYYYPNPPGNLAPNAPYYYNYYDPNAVSFQLHILSHKSIRSVEGLQLYFGGGPQLRILSYKYDYWYNPSYYPYAVSNYPYTETYHQVNAGVDGVFGTEYTFSAVPITVFADINLYIEIASNPFWLAIQGGVGARFNF